MKSHGYAWCWSLGTEGMLERLSGRRTAKNIAHSENSFPLQLLAEDIAAWFPEGALGEVRALW